MDVRKHGIPKSKALRGSTSLQAAVERYARMVPEALDTLAPEERHRVYNMLKLRVMRHADATLELSGALGHNPEVCKTETISGFLGTPKSLRLAWSGTSSAP